ncbi:MAG: magnesium chelatase subunit D family protein [Dyadobacter sp.]|uniref:magnesium chelatase subunit D family protein n=1 Tax=Dyadobacter sp. TaxID=1914288 RepID=UPI0032661B6C
MNLYPFSAIVGQEKLKKALLMCAINPAIGGVLIKGEKGTAKTTAVRGLSAIIPHTSQEEGFETEKMTVPFVDLPLGASEDRILGSLDLQAIVSEKKKKFLPGLLASAHQGILYIDEVNLLADHLVDILLDVAASGINTVQREGLSESHPARFMLIGTMNPEEGNLRPQFLDRFGLMVEVEGHMNLVDRVEVVRRRIAFESGPELFVSQWQAAQLTLQSQILKAQQLLPSVKMPEGLLTLISQLCIERSVSSLRADIVMFKTATALAAWAGRLNVTAEDIREAAELVLNHRQGKKQSQTNPNNQTDQQKSEPKENQDLGQNKDSEECGEGNCPEIADEKVFGSDKEAVVPTLKSEQPITIPELVNGRSQKALETSRGFQVRAEKTHTVHNLAVNETILHAVMRDPDHLMIRNEDLHQKVKNGKAGHLILFVVDASGSMAAGKRMEAVKGCILGLLKDAYQERDMVGLISFRGVEATILLEPTNSINDAEDSMDLLPTGGRTPLSHALLLASEVLKSYEKAKDLQPLLVVLSDGKANVPLPGGGDPWRQVLLVASQMAEKSVRALVIDTETGYLRFGKAQELASALGAECLSLDELSSENLTHLIKTRIIR